MNKYLVVFLLSLWHGLQAEEYYIERRFSWNGHTPVADPDRFDLLPSICSGTVSATRIQCNAMGGERVARLGRNSCTCECTEGKSTFGFHNSWKCIDNTIFHTLSGCLHRLENRSITDPIITIPSWANSGFIYWLPTLQSSNCSLTKIRYFTCRGTWQLLTSNTVKISNFAIAQYDHEDDDDDWHLKIVRSLYSIRGKVIKLNIKCQDPTLSHQYCVILKVKGEQQCSYLLPTPSQSTTIVPRIPSTISEIRPRPQPSSTIATIPTTKPTTTLKGTSQETVQTLTNPTTWASILTEPVSSKPDLTVGYPSTSTTRTKDSTPSFTATTSISVRKNPKKSASKESDKSGLIAGALAGIIGLAIIVMAIMVMVRRRKKRESNEQRTDTFDNAGYGRGQDNSLRFNGQRSPDEDEYSYAYNNAAPFVKRNKQDLESHTNNDHEPETSVVNHMYGQTDELNHISPASYNEAPVCNTLEEAVYAKVDKSKKKHPSNADAPTCNTLNEPEYAKVDKSKKTSRFSENHNDPLYNVLEGPETDEGLSEEPPCYQVPKGPYSGDAPVYDVLEEPESDEAPVYRALEGQDPHVYSALDKVPDIQGSPEENRGYDDMVYDSVGDVINDQGDIYQELNQSSQRDPGVYQALNYPGKTMHLNELNQTQSSA